MTQSLPFFFPDLSALALDHSDESILGIDEAGQILYSNKAALRTLGFSQRNFQGRQIWEVDRTLSQESYEALHGYLQQEKRKSYESVYQTGWGTRVPVEVKATLVDLGDHSLIFCYARNISARKQRQYSMQMMQEAIDRSHTAFFLLSPSGHVLYANNQACKSLGYSKSELLTLHLHHFDPWITEEGFQEFWETLRTNGSAKIRSTHKHRDGYVFPIEMSADYLKFNGEEHAFCYAEDITQREQMANFIQQLASHDPLTRLPNRTYLQESLKLLLDRYHEHGTPFCILFMDLDRFKYMNDSLGHQAGDEMLVEVAHRLRSNVREGDTVARLGGDEFVVVLPNTQPHEAERVALSLIAALNSPITLSQQLAIYNETSMGISCCPRDTTSIEELIKYADLAMYKAKETGGNSFYHFSADLGARAHARFRMDRDLRQAIEYNQFFLEFQPQISICDGNVTGVEALLRWRHPERGLVSPAEFIPVAEATGQIVTIGRQVFREACRIQCELKAKVELHIPISVNLSVRQLQDEGLADFIEKQLKVFGLAPEDLVIEVTESIMLSNETQAETFFGRMKALGINFAIDDFGTGYSSLSNLRKLPLSKLKIDRSFIQNVFSNKQDAIMVKSMIGIGHQFGLKVIAEGVETLEQLQFLKQNRCDQVQGYLISKPLQQGAFEQFLQACNKA